jgi:hypothetical protein
VTITSTQLRSFIGPIWHEISSLWSGVDFSFSDLSPDSAEQSEEAFFPRVDDPQSGYGASIRAAASTVGEVLGGQRRIAEVSQLLGQR